MKANHIQYGWKPNRFRNLVRRLRKRGWQVFARCFNDPVTVTDSVIAFATTAIVSRESRILELTIS